MENFAINLPAYPNLSAYGQELRAPAGNWPVIYVYSFYEIFSNTQLYGAVSFVQNDADPDQFSYAVNEKATLPPFNADLVNACIANFELKFGVTPVAGGTFGQATGADRYIVVFDADTVYTATEFRDLTTGLRQVLYSVESTAGALQTMLNAARYFESNFNVWEPPVLNPFLVSTFGAPVALSIQNHFSANFDI